MQACIRCTHPNFGQDHIQVLHMVVSGEYGITLLVIDHFSDTKRQSVHPVGIQPQNHNHFTHHIFNIVNTSKNCSIPLHHVNEHMHTIKCIAPGSSSKTSDIFIVICTWNIRTHTQTIQTHAHTQITETHIYTHTYLHFREDASYRPHVQRRSVMLPRQHNFRGPIPHGGDIPMPMMHGWVTDSVQSGI